jgi:hypothetical protein
LMPLEITLFRLYGLIFISISFGYHLVSTYIDITL